MDGSFGRIQGSGQWGKQIDNYAVYGALEGLHDNGFRNFSPSDIRRFYSDVGYRNDVTEGFVDPYPVLVDARPCGVPATGDATNVVQMKDGFSYQGDGPDRGGRNQIPVDSVSRGTGRPAEKDCRRPR